MEGQVTVTLAINLDIDPGESRESILRRVMTILEESDTYNLDAIFDDVAVSGIDF